MAGRVKYQSSGNRHTAGDKTFYIAAFTWLGLAGFLVLYPMIYVIACSFSSTQAIISGRVFLWPVDVSLAAYKAVFEYHLLRTGFLNSLLYVAGGTATAVTLLLLAAYPLSRRDLPGRKFFQVFFVVTMFFNGGIIPNYILMRNLHFIGSRWALIIPFLFSCYNMIIVKSFFQNSLPPGLLDAAHIDGCGDTQFFFSIALPLAAPVISVMVLFNAVGNWNGYFRAMMYLTKSSTYNFQQVLRDILFIAQMPPDMLAAMDPNRVEQLQNLLEQLRYAVLVVGALPMMLLYPFIQKYFIRGMMIGSLKE
ncbi:MAG: carbohydrate ABC transporter permease [Treponema sp.]|jgi:multiple sugar transport system permease protein/putative aldouronate transport system permease protein|nr:carbohydrate ABC transporter permease [Treponema sp.]